MTIDVVSEWKCHEGRQLVIEHRSGACGVPMRLSVFLPRGVRKPPVLYFLSGLTCTWENVTTKGFFQRAAAEHGIAVVCPDTSPRGDDVHDAPDRWDLGKGAGFYVDATAEPWSKHYQMYSYVVDEVPALVGGEFDIDTSRAAVTGHSMGGHGALVVGLRNPDRYASISAFSPIVAPTKVQWGEDAFGAYLAEKSEWSDYDACELVQRQPRPDIELLVEQGAADSFLGHQLRTELFETACKEAGQPLQVNLRDGYDHSYYFVSTFLGDHVARHARALAT